MAWLGRLWPHLSSAVPGSAAGDNLAFVWNTWWLGQSGIARVPFWTPMIFAPWGVNLALHTHTALPSAVAALAFPASALAGTNIVVALDLFLNFAAAYALAWRTTGNARASVVAGLVYGWSPFVSAHLAGHFNLVAAWTLPVAALAVQDVLEGVSRRRGALWGVVFGSIAYVDYYLAVYAFVLGAAVLAHRALAVSVRSRVRSRVQTIVLRSIGGLLMLDAIVLGAIATTGGTVAQIGGLHLSLRGTANPISAAGLLVMLAVAVRLAPAIRVHVAWRQLQTDAGSLALPGVVALMTVLPILASAARMWIHGDYVSQTYFWRSAPAGIDLATLFLGNPGAWLTGAATSRAYSWLGIDGVERVAWAGPSVLALCAAAIIRAPSRSSARRWLIVAAVFLLWAVGPRLTAFGRDLQILMPATLIRYLPVLSNARIPSRAIAGVYLALSGTVGDRLRDAREPATDPSRGAARRAPGD